MHGEHPSSPLNSDRLLIALQIRRTVDTNRDGQPTEHHVSALSRPTWTRIAYCHPSIPHSYPLDIVHPNPLQTGLTLARSPPSHSLPFTAASHCAPTSYQFLVPRENTSGRRPSCPYAGSLQECWNNMQRARNCCGAGRSRPIRSLKLRTRTHRVHSSHAMSRTMFP